MLRADERHHTHVLTREFLASDEAYALQGELAALDREAATRGGSYVSGFWHSMYVELRCAQPVNTTPYLRLASPAAALAPAADAQLVRAAELLHDVTAHRHALLAGTLAADTLKTRALDMRQVAPLHGATRVPVDGARDVLLPMDADARHVVVLRRQRAFALRVADARGAPRSVGELLAALDAIRRTADARGDALPALALSGLPRARWAAFRSRLLDESPVNRETIDAIERATFVLALDETPVPDGDDDAYGHALLHGAERGASATLRTRFWDKQQMVVMPDGSASSLLEHTAVDGDSTLSMWRFADEQARARRSNPDDALGAAPVQDEHVYELVRRARALSLSLPASRPLLRRLTRQTTQRFDVDDAELKRDIEAAQHDYVAQVADVDHSALRCSMYGSSLIKAHKLSPDAFCQVSNALRRVCYATLIDATQQAMFQIAYWKTHGKTESTYESVSTRRYAAGRTEVMRSVTPQSAFLQRVWDSERMVMGDGKAVDVTYDTKVRALRDACAAHVARAKLAQEGKAVDRHLYSLLQLARAKERRLETYEIPRFFHDPAFSRLMTSVISTSNVSAPFFDMFGFGAGERNLLSRARHSLDHSLLLSHLSPETLLISFNSHARRHWHCVQCQCRPNDIFVFELHRPNEKVSRQFCRDAQGGTRPARERERRQLNLTLRSFAFCADFALAFSLEAAQADRAAAGRRRRARPPRHRAGRQTDRPCAEQASLARQQTAGTGTARAASCAARRRHARTSCHRKSDGRCRACAGAAGGGGPKWGAGARASSAAR